jgi:hypothetical protein
MWRTWIHRVAIALVFLVVPTGAVYAQNFSATPTNLVFGNVPVGATASLPVTVTNLTAVPQTPNYAGGAPNDPTNFGGSQNCAGVTLAPGGSCTFTYTFSPASLGAKSSSTTIDIDSETFSITMSGTGGSFTVVPTSLSFGAVVVGGSASLPVTITNVSAASLTPSFSGGAPLDSINFDASQNCAGTTLVPGGSCTFTYTFHPTSAGAKSTTTTIGIDSDTFAITLSGTALLALAPAPIPTLPQGSLGLLAAAIVVIGLSRMHRRR